MIHRLTVVTSFVLFSLVASPLWSKPTVELIPGRPFGVGRITVPLAADDANLAQVVPRLSLADADNRVFYPTIEQGKFRELIGGLFGGGDNALPGQATAYFLFQGDGPLKLTFYTPVANTIVATPAAGRPRQFDRLLNTWWREYQSGAKARAAAGEIPPVVDAYLTTMLSQRLKLPLARENETAISMPQQTMDLLLGVEKVRAQTLRATLMGQNLPAAPLDQPLPKAWSWADVYQPAAAEGGPAIEPIAKHVPVECFYIRFGKFSNYLWLDNLTEDYGGDLANMISLRGQDLDLGGRVQTQLCLQKNKLADLLGDTVIADVAMIGRDIYTHEGAAIGMLFQARNTKLLGNDFTQTRAAVLKREEPNGATLENVEIAGRSVSLLSTPDNRLRSFYAVDGDFHLVTTSRAIVERFFAVGKGEGALGNSEEFARARTKMAIDRQDTIFAYFSSAFFFGLVSPQYQIELSRRLEAVTDIELLQLARLAARGEGQPSETIDDLIAGGFLPRGFGKRADGSGPIVEPNKVVDSRRGARGAFLPVADVELKGISAAEAARWQQFNTYLTTQWKTMDPLMVGIKRFKLDDKGRERVAVEALVAPFSGQKYGTIAAMIGPPVKSRILPVTGDVIHVQAMLQGSPLDPNAPPHHMFLGVQDHVPLGELKSANLLKILRLLQTTPGYLGAYPRPGTLDMLPLGLGGVPDQFGFAQMPLGLWRRTLGPWSVLSFDPQLLGEVSEQLAVEDTDNPAQIRIHVKDLAASRAAPWVNSLFYERARQTSVANAALLQHLMQQMRVPADQAVAAVETLIDGKLVCVMGGKYESAAYRDGATLWQSSAWPMVVDQTPADYQAPILTWFRGLDADLTKVDNQLMVRAQLDMQRKKVEPTLELPSFNLPNIFGDFGKTSPKKKPEKVPVPEEIPAPSEKKAREF